MQSTAPPGAQVRAGLDFPPYNNRMAALLIHRYTGLGLLGVSMATTSLFRYIVMSGFLARPYFTTLTQGSSTPAGDIFSQKKTRASFWHGSRHFGDSPALLRGIFT